MRDVDEIYFIAQFKVYLYTPELQNFVKDDNNTLVRSPKIDNFLSKVGTLCQKHVCANMTIFCRGLTKFCQGKWFP